MKQAIQLLGTSIIMPMILELTVGGSLNMELKHYGIPTSGLRKHSLCAGITAKELTKYCGILPFTPDTAFTAGLLHDIGKIALNEVLSGSESCLTDKNESLGKSITELERELIGADHAEVGALVLEEWKFPIFFCEAVGQHHLPTISNQLSHLIHIANWCAHSIDLAFGYQSPSDDLYMESISAVLTSQFKSYKNRSNLLRSNWHWLK